MNIYDDVFGGVLQNLEQAEQAIEGEKFDPRGPFVNGCDLDWNMDDKALEEIYNYGAEPFTIGRRG